MKFVVSGLPGCGASTLALLLAKTLNLTLYKGSESFRYLAKQLGATTNHEETHLIEDKVQPYWGPIYDTYTAHVLSNTQEKNLVIDSDIAGFMVEKGDKLCRIFLHSNIETRIKHFSTDDRPAQIEEVQEIDNKLDREYRDLHNIDFLNLDFVKTKYELMIDNSDLSIADELILVYQYLLERDWISNTVFDSLSSNAQTEDSAFWQMGKPKISEVLKQKNQIKSGIEVLKEAKSLYPEEITNLPSHLTELFERL